MADDDKKPGDETEPGSLGSGENVCPLCHGEGTLGGKECPRCMGAGKVTEGIGSA